MARPARSLSVLVPSLVALVLDAGCLRAGFGGLEPEETDGGPDATRQRPEASTGPVTQTHGGAADPTWKGTAQASVATSSTGDVSLAEGRAFQVKSAQLAQASAWSAASVREGAIYVFGGALTVLDASRTKDVQRYDPVADTITTVTTMPKDLSMSEAVTAADGKIYLVKGYDTAITLEGSVQAFDPQSLMLTTVTSGLITANRHAAILVGGAIHILGGYGTGPMRPEIQSFDLTTKGIVTSLSSLNSVGGPRTSLRACLASNGKVYIFGGSKTKTSDPANGADITEEILEYTPGTQGIASAGKLPVRLMNAVVGQLRDGKIYVVGGDTGASAGTCCTRSQAVYTFDPSTHTVATLVNVSLPYGLSGAAAAVSASSKLYLLGGRTESGLSRAILEFPPYATSGTLLGPVVDTGAPATAWQELDWSATTPDKTSVTIETRAADKAFTASAASGPSWAAVGSTPPVKTGLPAGRYMQWRVTFSSTSTAVSPTLRRLSMRYGRP